jgi:transglutaminase-like putative cysteine protease
LDLLKRDPLTIVLFVSFRASRDRCGERLATDRPATPDLSNSMAPGSISRLLESGEIVSCPLRWRPAGQRQALLARTGLRIFNGRAWSPLQQRTVDPAPLSIEADVRSETSYTVTLEPHKRDWLFALEAPAAIPLGGELRAKLTPEMQLLADDLVSQRLRYEMRSFTRFQFGATASELELQDWRVLPPNFNPRTMQFASELRSRFAAGPGTGVDGQLVTAVIDHFRRGGYQYSLAPPRLGRHSVDEFLFDTREGYCEHYSSAFVVLMRALDIPARVVTGYQGGELNPVDNFLTVRQSDAHAWAEVWLQGRGWVRVDPTAAVAPMRIDRGAAELARQSGIVLPGAAGDFSWLRSVRFNWEAVQNAWNQWVLSYSQEHQRALADLLGLAPTLESIALVLAAVIGVLLAVMAALSLRSRAVRDPLGDAYRQLRDKLDQAGVTTAEHLGPRELYSRSKRALERQDVLRARKLLSRYERMRYSRSSEAVSAADVRALRRAIRTFRSPRLRHETEPARQRALLAVPLRVRCS